MTTGRYQKENSGKGCFLKWNKIRKGKNIKKANLHIADWPFHFYYEIISLVWNPYKM